MFTASGHKTEPQPSTRDMKEILAKDSVPTKSPWGRTPSKSTAAVLNLWVATTTRLNQSSCIPHIYIRIHSSCKITINEIATNNFMVGVTTPWEAVLKGLSALGKLRTTELQLIKISQSFLKSQTFPRLLMAKSGFIQGIHSKWLFSGNDFLQPLPDILSWN